MVDPKDKGLATRMKEYEHVERSFLPRRQYIVIRVDGRAFHTWTRGLEKPFSHDLVDIMAETAKDLAEEASGALVGYVQSDEISLILQDFKTAGTEPWFGGNVQKIASVSAGIATAAFNKHLSKSRISTMRPASFDGRVYTLPSREEVSNYLLWRRRDATKNSITMIAHAGFSARELDRKTTSDRFDMITDPFFQVRTGIKYSRIPRRFLHGQLITRETTMERLTYFDKRTQQQVTTDKPVERRRWTYRPVTDEEVAGTEPLGWLEHLPEIPKRDRPKEARA